MIIIFPMKTGHVLEAVKIWRHQFHAYCNCDAFPDFMNGGHLTIEAYMKEQIDKGNAIIAMKDNEVVGFMAWMYFDFHNEKTAFLPIVGHAALLSDELNIYSKMYCFASQKWVSDERFNHLWMTYFDDHYLKDRLYDLGFGSYVIDACQSTSITVHDVKQTYQIALALTTDVDALTDFANSTNEYYVNSPIFLQRDHYTKDELKEWIDKNYALLAWDNDKIIGAMNFTINQGFHLEHLTTPDSSYIDGLGAFILPNYRGKGVGTALLDNVFAICNKKGKPYIHVSYESANPNAIRFWPKYFKPAIRSVRRTINKDISTRK